VCSSDLVSSFCLLVFINVLLMASTGAPSPIYPLYMQRWGFTVTVLTVVFAVYVVGLVGALLTAGSLSDHLGRRPVLVVSLLVGAAGTGIFWAARGVVLLVIARAVQGLATGTATGALAAGLVEFSPEARPHLGPTMTAVGTNLGLDAGASRLPARPRALKQGSRGERFHPRLREDAVDRLRSRTGKEST